MAYPDKFEYLRHPGKWEEVEKNLDFYYSLHTGSYPVNVQITHTVTALNVMYWPYFMNTLQTDGPSLIYGII